MSGNVGGPEDTGTAPNNALLRPDDYRTKDGAFNQINSENQLLKIDFSRIFNGYRQIVITHAELLLDLPQEWRDYLLNDLYVSTIHPDVRDDIITALGILERFYRLKGATV